MSPKIRPLAPVAMLSLSLAAALAPARAQTARPDADADALDRVVVTASRIAEPADAALAAVTVIDRARIERLQPSSLPDLLRGLPGVSLANNGGAGKATSLFLRGTESDHTLVLVDGLRIGSATSGGAALQDIPVDQIERIEIVRGPFSSLYGSDAIGGVIQIFTRRPASGFAPNLSVGAGSFDTQRASAGVGGRGDAGWYAVQAAHETTGGINAYRGDPSRARPESWLDADEDGYRNTSLSLRAGTRVGQAWTLEGHALRAEGFNEYDGSINNASDSVQQVAGARVRFAPGETLALTFNAGRTADRSDAYQRGAFSSRFDTLRELGSLQADIEAGAGTASVGIDWKRDEVDSSTPYAVASRITRGGFGQWRQDIGAHALQFSARHDDDAQFGGQSTGSASWGWGFAPGLRLSASLGSAYKAPTFNELYFPGYGIPTLRPETSRSAELGLKGRGDVLGWSVHAFQTRIDDLIVYNPAIPPFGGPDNIDRARIRGLEATADGDLAGWAVRASATWLDPRNASGGVLTGKVLPRRARVAGRVDLDRRFGAFSAGASVSGAGDRFDDVANRRRLGGYALTDLRLGYDLARDWSLQLTATNVFDRRYETASFYNQPGRGAFLGLRYRPAR
jgi:vitamin B12 transporter